MVHEQSISGEDLTLLTADQPDSARAESSVHDALNAIVRDSLAPTTLGLALLFAFFAVSHLFVLPDAAVVPMVSIAATTSAAMLSGTWLLRRATLPLTWAQPVAAGIAGLVFLNSFAHLALLNDPQHTTNLALLIIGIGCFFLSRRWLAFALVVILVSWATLALRSDSPQDWLHFAFMLVATTMLSVLIHDVRLVTFRRIERLRQRDAAQKHDLEATLHTLQKRENQYRAVVQTAGSVIVVLSPQHHILEFNAEAERVLGYARHEVIGQSYPALFLPVAEQEIVAARMNCVLAGNVVHDVEQLTITRDGHTVILLWNATRLIDHEGHVIGLVGMGRDITARKQVEEQLRCLNADLERRVAERTAELATALENEQAARAEAEAALEVRDQFLSIASHELNQPLAVICSSIDLLQRRLDKGTIDITREQRLVGLLGTQADRIHKLTASFLDVSRIRQGTLGYSVHTLNLQRVVEQVVEEVQMTSDQHTLVAIYPDQVVMLAGDELRLAEVVHNLLRNAIKYSPCGGTVTVQLAYQGNEAVLSVRDQGIGIPEADQSLLFKRYYRASNAARSKQSGMGIGLYLVNEIVRWHGGTVAVNSREGEGSTFIVRLPLTAARSSEA